MSRNKIFRCAYFFMHFKKTFLLFNSFPSYVLSLMPELMDTCGITYVARVGVRTVLHSTGNWQQRLLHQLDELCVFRNSILGTQSKVPDCSQMTLPHSHQVSPATCRHSTCTRVEIYVNVYLQQTVCPTHSSNCSSNVFQIYVRFFSGLNRYLLVPVSARSKAWVCGPSVATIVGSNLAGVWISVSCECFVLPGRSLCVGLITRPEEAYRARACVCVCVCVCHRV